MYMCAHNCGDNIYIHICVYMYIYILSPCDVAYLFLVALFDFFFMNKYFNPLNFQ